MYVQEGKMVAHVEERYYQFRAGDWLNLADDFLPYLGYWLDPKKLPQVIKSLRALQETIRKHLVAVASVSAEKGVMTERKVFPDFLVLQRDLAFFARGGPRW